MTRTDAQPRPSPFPFRACLRGRFTPTQLYRYTAALSAVFWGLIGLAWLGYPAENQYSIRTHTFSFLGSYETRHSPTWWWLFTLAMVFWSLAAVPLVLHIHRAMARLSRRGARVGTVFLLLGCVSIGLVGLIPDVRTPLGPHLRVGHIHARVALGVAIGFIAGFFSHGLLLVRDRHPARRRLSRPGVFLLPYACWTGVVGVASFFLIRWEFVYADMKAAAHAAGTRIGSSWSEAMGTPYAFPLWENILIYTLFASLIWISIAVLKAHPGQEKRDR